MRFLRSWSLFSGALTLGLTLASCGNSPGSAPAVPAYQAGTVTENGFQLAENGLPFQNYGGILSSGLAPVNMTAADVEKMFGGSVCADALARKCDLIPEAQAWLTAINQAMAGGHCYGFSVLAGLIWEGKLSAASFGAPSVTGLQISGNAALQRQIAYDWALQTLSTVRSQRITGTPNKVLLALIAGLKRGQSQAYTLVFWKRDGTGGHAVTPYAVISKGNGMFDVMIYDNNFPGQSRAVSFDTRADTWSYDAAVNPDEPTGHYEGDAGTKTISLDPASTGLGTQPCPFCAKVPKTAASGSGHANTEQVSLSGSLTNHADLVVSDEAGHQIGYVHGSFVDQIHGSSGDPVISDADWTNTTEPYFNLPADQKYTFTLDGSDLTSPDNETISIVGPSFDVSIKGITINPGEKDGMVVEPDATRLSYTASGAATPTVDLGVSDIHADYSFEISGKPASPGSTVNVALPAEGGALGVQTVGDSTESPTIGLKVTRETPEGVDVFQNGAIPLAGGDSASFKFGPWTGSGQALTYTLNHHGVLSTLSASNGAPA